MAAGKSAVAQLRLRCRQSAGAADEFVADGFTAVVSDVALGPILEEWGAKVAYGGITPEHLDDVLRTATSRIGLWIDSSSQRPDETVDAILADLDAARL
jgi:hypothetical protein